MRLLIAFAVLTTAACGDRRPPAPTAEESAKLNDADAMLDQAGNEEGPEARAPDPSINTGQAAGLTD
ncbi:MAG: hypothetical protein ABIR51_02450 [Sphingomicrobium sp.]